jgi:hypothetical protein
MGVIIEICVKYPGGPTRNKGTDILHGFLCPDPNCAYNINITITYTHCAAYYYY